jgi:hypothetical protein
MSSSKRRRAGAGVGVSRGGGVPVANGYCDRCHRTELRGHSSHHVRADQRSGALLAFG